MVRRAQLLLKLLEQGLGILRVPVLQNTQQIALDVVNALSGVIGIDDDAGNVGFGRFIGDVSNGVLHGGQGRRAVDHGGRQQQGDDAADDLAAGFVPAGELDPAMKPAEHQQSAGGQQQMACGQEPGGDQTNHQHRAADQQHSEGGQTKPIRPAAAGGGVFSCHSVSPLCWDKSPVRRFAEHTHCNLHGNSLLLYILRRQISILICNKIMNFPIFTGRR